MYLIITRNASFPEKGKLNVVSSRKARNSNRILEKDGKPADTVALGLIGS
jgi:hypothetical protein